MSGLTGAENPADPKQTDAPAPAPPTADLLTLSVVIPCYNEAATIEETIRRVRAVDLGSARREIVVVDDASVDGTAERVAALAGPDLRLVVQPRNQGKGAALREGFRHATGDWILVQDADLEYFPEDYPALLEAAREHRPEAVYGSRFLRGRPEGMQAANYVANRVLAWAATLLFGRRITDEATAYKMFRRDALLAVDLTCRRYEFCPEVTAKILRSGGRIVEVPIRYRARTVEEGKKITWWDGVVALWTLLKYRFVR